MTLGERKADFGISLLFVWMGLSLGCGERPKTLGEELIPALTVAGDWQSACEARMDSAPPTSVLMRKMTTETRWVLDPSPPLGRVVGLAWDPRRSQVVVADMTLGQVSILDSLGQRVSTFGQQGEGPGDLNIKWVGGATNRLALLGDSEIVVADIAHTKVFSRDGRLHKLMKIDSLSSVDWFDVQTLPLSEQSFIATRTGKRHRLASEHDLDERTRLTLVRVDLSTTQVSFTEIGFLRNSYVMLRPAVPFPGYQPYRSDYRRSWAGFPTGAVAISWTRFGVCYFDWTGRLLAAYSLDAKRLRVDEKEKERVLKAEMGTSGHVPFEKLTAAELYRSNWPSEGPLYVDAVADQGGTAWLLRRTQEDGQVVDVYTPSGYLGSFAHQDRRLPLLLRDSMAFYFNGESGTVDVELIKGFGPHP